MTIRRVSLNEILRLSKRVFLALGAGPGCEYDPALAVVWLESRGLPGLEMLWRDRDAPRHGVPPSVTESPQETSPRLGIQGEGTSAVWIAAATADWLVAGGVRARVQADGICSPLWFLPALAARAGDMPGWMQAKDAEGELVLEAQWDEQGVALYPQRTWNEFLGLSVAVTLACGALPSAAASEESGLSPQRLDARHAASLAAGVEVDESRWLALYDLAREALVPESEASRLRGAGAQEQ